MKKQQKHDIAIDFAVLTLSFSENDFFPFQKEDVRNSALGQYFLEKGYSTTEIKNFVEQVRSRELQTATEILLS